MSPEDTAFFIKYLSCHVRHPKGGHEYKNLSYQNDHSEILSFNLGHCNSKGDIWHYYGSISFDNHSHDKLLNFILNHN